MGLLKLCYQNYITCMSIYKECVQLHNHIFKKKPYNYSIQCCFKTGLNLLETVLFVRKEVLPLLSPYSLWYHSELELLKTQGVL